MDRKKQPLFSVIQQILKTHLPAWNSDVTTRKTRLLDKGAFTGSTEATTLSLKTLIDATGTSTPPPKIKTVERSVPNEYKVTPGLTKYLQYELTKERGNQQANQSFELGGIMFNDIPVTVIMTLIEKLSELRQVVMTTPLREGGFDWTFSNESGVWTTPKVTEVTERTYTAVRWHQDDEKKFAPQQYTEKVSEPTGTKSKSVQSGASSYNAVQESLKIIDSALETLKRAKDEANAVVIDIAQEPFKQLFEKIFSPMVNEQH